MKSPNALAQDKAIPAKIEFRSSGSETVKKVLIGLAPKFKEASSSFVFSCAADDSIAKIKNGKDTNEPATTAPVVVNGSLSPSQLSSLSPIKPFLPSANNSAVPPATGGSTIGKRTILSLITPGCRMNVLCSGHRKFLNPKEKIRFR